MQARMERLAADRGAERDRRHILMRRLVLVLTATVLIAGCDSSGPGASGAGPVATNAASAALLPDHVSELPSFDFDTFERLMYQLRGTPVVVNLWASWCGPCKHEAALLADAANRYSKEVQFLGVDYQDRTAPAIAYAAQFHITFPSVTDGSGEIHDRLGFIGLPDTVFYGADGSIVGTWSGPITAEALRENVERLLSGSGQA